MPVINVRSIVSPLAARLGLTLTPIGNLFLNAIQISRGPVPLSGSITRGTAAHPGSAQISVDAVGFTDLQAQAVVGSRVTLTYDSVSLEVLQIEISRGGSSAAAVASSEGPDEVAAE